MYWFTCHSTATFCSFFHMKILTMSRILKKNMLAPALNTNSLHCNCTNTRCNSEKLCCWTEMITNKCAVVLAIFIALMICTCVNNLKIGNDYKEGSNVDQLLCIDTDHIWKCFIIDNGSALYHVVCPTVENSRASSRHTFPTAHTIDLSAVHIHTFLFKSCLCIVI